MVSSHKPRHSSHCERNVRRMGPHNKATSYTKCIYFITRTLFWLGSGGQSWCNPYQPWSLNAILAWPSAMRSLNFCRPLQTCIVFYRKIKQHKFITVCCCLTLLQLTRKAYERNVTWGKTTKQLLIDNLDCNRTYLQKPGCLLIWKITVRFTANFITSKSDQKARRMATRL